MILFGAAIEDLCHNLSLTQQQPGDAVVFVSDGILDAENEFGEMYGEERLAKLICGSRGLPAQHIADGILADVTQFQGSKDRFDDETIIVLCVK